MKKEKVANYVKSRNDSLATQKYGDLTIIFKDRFINDIDYKNVLSRVNNLLPEHFLELIDVIYVGDFDFLRKRLVNAAYSDGAIYVSNIEQDNEKDLLDDIIHEFAHAVEEKYGYFIYTDGKIEDNFLGKRNRLRSLLKFDNYDISLQDFTNPKFDPTFDDFIRKEIGYKKLDGYIKNLFLGGYSITSLREYFARGFEEYYIGKPVYLKSICPYIYIKLFSLHQGENLYEV
jgi:hypothetical protein